MKTSFFRLIYFLKHDTLSWYYFRKRQVDISIISRLICSPWKRSMRWLTRSTIRLITWNPGNGELGKLLEWVSSLLIIINISKNCIEGGKGILLRNKEKNGHWTSSGEFFPIFSMIFINFIIFLDSAKNLSSALTN